MTAKRSGWSLLYPAEISQLQQHLLCQGQAMRCALCITQSSSRRDSEPWLHRLFLQGSEPCHPTLGKQMQAMWRQEQQQMRTAVLQVRRGLHAAAAASVRLAGHVAWRLPRHAG